MPFFRFYPYIMLTSCFFLVVTMIVYSFVPKLLNSYSKLMLHYSTSLMLGLLCMAVIQLGNNWHEKPKSCSFLGKCANICDSELESFDTYNSFYSRFYHTIFLRDRKKISDRSLSGGLPCSKLFIVSFLPNFDLDYFPFIISVGKA